MFACLFEYVGVANPRIVGLAVGRTANNFNDNLTSVLNGKVEFCGNEARLKFGAGEKFRTVKGGKGIAYTVPMTSVIGVAIYQFLSNNNGGGFI